MPDLIQNPINYVDDLIHNAMKGFEDFTYESQKIRPEILRLRLSEDDAFELRHCMSEIGGLITSLHIHRDSGGRVLVRELPGEKNADGDGVRGRVVACAKDMASLTTIITTLESAMPKITAYMESQFANRAAGSGEDLDGSV